MHYLLCCIIVHHCLPRNTVSVEHLELGERAVHSAWVASAAYACNVIIVLYVVFEPLTKLASRGVLCGQLWRTGPRPAPSRRFKFSIYFRNSHNEQSVI